ncbi:aminoglycoside phosphotransferase family protein [Calditrichota bacterium]
MAHIIPLEHAEVLESLFRTFTGQNSVSIVKLKGDASLRSIYRLSAPKLSYIGIFGPNREENRAFLGFTKTFRDLNLPVPELCIQDEDGYHYLLEDLGDITLFKKLNQHREESNGAFPRKKITPLYYEAIKQLVRFQVMGADKLDYSLCYQSAEFDEQAWKTDQDYFVDSFARAIHPNFKDWNELSKDLHRHRRLLEPYPKDYFLYRDFQSRNIMVTDKLRFIDYQSGRLGAVSYDIASILFDARADLPIDFRNELLELHISMVSEETGMSRDMLHEAFGPYALIRVLQALGAYGKLGIKQGKKDYLESIPYGIKNAISLIENDSRMLKFQALYDLLHEISDSIHND